MSEELIERIINRDEEALEDLQQQSRGLLALVTRGILQNDEDVEEVINEVMLKVWNNISSFDSQKGSFNSWITTIAHNTAIDKLKRKDKTVEYNDEILYEALDNIHLKGLIDEILVIAEGLNSKEKELFRLKYQEQLSTEQIMGKTGLSKRAVESSLYRIRNKIRERLENKNQAG